MNSIEISNRLQKCFSSVIHDVMRDRGHKNFTLPPNIRPTKEKYRIAGQIFTMEGSTNPEYDHHETILAWTGFLSKAPATQDGPESIPTKYSQTSIKCIICDLSKDLQSISLP